jgi:hypothetical protein
MAGAAQLPWRHALRLKLRYGLWSARNYADGYAWSPVRRWRCCGHLTPFHAAGCGVPW